ncbi:MAG: 7TM diverse intracellular signaling domain-containing protein [Pseudomonadota bacterium]
MAFSYIYLRFLRQMAHIGPAAACTRALTSFLSCLLLWLAASGLLQPAAAQQTPAEKPAPPSLTELSSYWIDNNTGSRLGPEQVSADTGRTWNSPPPKGIYPLKARESLWIRFTLPPTAGAESWLLEIPYPALDSASLYTQNPQGQWTAQHTGDLTSVNQWPTPHRFPLLTLAMNADAPTHFLLRINNAQGFSAPLQVVDAAGVLRNEQLVSLFLGSYFGLALLGVAIGLAGALYLKDRAYLYYAACSALVGLTQAAITGVAALHLWPDSPWWADRALVVLASWMLMSVLLLSTSIVSLRQRSKTLNALAWLVMAMGAALSVALGITDSAIRLPLLTPYILLVLVMILTVNFWAWRHGDRFGGWLLLSAAPFALGLALAVARYLQWIPLSVLTEQSVHASMALELPAMLAVLVLRSRHRHENTRRIKGLDRMDPSTGLVNDQVFLERMVRMIARSERLKHQSAVMLIDIINSEQTQRDFGRKVADELPLRVAERLLSTAREIDSAARLSERRFGMLVEGPFSADDAATLGPRIVARCLMPYKGLHVDCVAHVRVAYALVPHQGSNALDLVSRLEDRLAMAPADDKKAVFMLGEHGRGHRAQASKP